MTGISDFRPDAVIVGGGDFPTHELPLQLLHSAPFICCCDGAAAACMRRGVRVDAVVGDGDSLPEAFKRQLGDRWHHISEQDDNDQTKATRFCMARGMNSIAYIAATGRREDHTLGNISLLVKYLRDWNINVRMITDHGVFIPCRGSICLKTLPRQQVSVFNFSCSEMHSEGLKWDVYNFSELWQGTLNEATGDKVSIEGNGLFLVFVTFETKKP